MSLRDGSSSLVANRLALEALRSGVPNRAAVRLLGCNQPHVEERFNDMLNSATGIDGPARQCPGDADLR